MNAGKKRGDEPEVSSKPLRDPNSGPGIEDPADGLETKAELHAAKEYTRYIVDTVHEALLVLTKDLRVESANRAFYELFQTSPEETVGQSVFEFMDGQWDSSRLRELLEKILPEDKELVGFEIEQHFEGLGHRIMLLNARQLDDHELILLAIEDVTEERRTMQELKVLTGKLEERVEERTRQVEVLAAALAEAEEKERERIADVLHDHIQQLLYGAELALRTLRRSADELAADEAKEKCHRLLGQLGEALEEAQEATRTLSVELNPPLLRGDDIDWASNGSPGTSRNVTA